MYNFILIHFVCIALHTMVFAFLRVCVYIIYIYIYIYISHTHTLLSYSCLLSTFLLSFFLFKASRKYKVSTERTYTRTGSAFSVFHHSLLSSFLPISLSTDFFFLPLLTPLPYFPHSLFYLPPLRTPSLPPVLPQPPPLLLPSPLPPRPLLSPPANSSN